MKEEKLSPQERELLEPFYEMNIYQKALKPVMERIGNGISRHTAELSQDWNNVMYNRGRLAMLKELHAYIKQINEDSRKKSGN